MGSVLNASYRAGVDVSALLAPAAAAVQRSVFAGLAVAQQLHSVALAQSVRSAFVTAMDAVLLASVGVALLGLVLTLLFLPNVRAARENERPSELAGAPTA